MDYFVDLFPNYKPSFSFLLAVSIPMLGMQIVSYALQRIIALEVKLSGALFLNTSVAVLIAVIPESVHSESFKYYFMLFLMIL